LWKAVALREKIWLAVEKLDVEGRVSGWEEKGCLWKKEKELRGSEMGTPSRLVGLKGGPEPLYSRDTLTSLVVRKGHYLLLPSVFPLCCGQGASD
jgi:hypothetical protein